MGTISKKSLLSKNICLPAISACPKITFDTEVETVVGPSMTKVSRSNRIWQIFVLHLQTFALQAPLLVPEL